MRITKRRALTAIPTLLFALSLLCAPLENSAHAATTYVPKDATGGYDTLADAFLAGETSVTLRCADSSVSAIPTGTTVTLSGSGEISVGTGELIVYGAVAGSGSISAGSIYLDGGSIASSSVRYSCTVYTNVTLTGLAAVPITKIVGTDGTDTTPQNLGNGRYKTSASGTIIAAYDGNGTKYVPVNGTFTQQFSIVYLDQSGKAITPSASGSYVYPASCTALDAPFTIGDPKIPGYTFLGWITESGLQNTVLVTPGALTGNVVFVASLSTESSGGSTGKAGAGGGVAGGGAGTFSAAAARTTTADDDDDDSTAAAATAASTAVASTVSTRGQRVRTATSTTRHTINATEETDIEALASARARRKTFPWQWVGVGIGGAAVLTALLFTVRRRRAEKYAATLEKLRIYE